MNDHYEEVEINLSTEELANLALEAHDNRITLNQHINNKLRVFVDGFDEELPEDNLLKMSNLKKIAEELEMEFVDLRNTTKDAEAFDTLGYKYCLENMLIPFRFEEEDEGITVASKRPLDAGEISEVSYLSNYKVNKVLLADEKDILSALSEFVGEIN
jgi:hypothetical protein